jgi:hypothetical protein
MILDSNIILGILALISLALVADVFFLRRKIRTMLRGEKNCNVCESIDSVSQEIKALEKFKSEMEKYLVSVESRLRRSNQAVETIRFNAFRDSGVGGNQSFATAMINENGDGVVISSLYSRERVSVFSKQVSSFNSEIELSEEERKAISGAKTKLGNK